MGKFKFLHASAISKIPSPGSISEPCCLETLRLFTANAELALGTTRTPAFVFWMAMEWIGACTRAKTFILGDESSPKRLTANAPVIGLLAEEYMETAMKLNRDQQVAHLVEKTEMFERFCVDAGPNAEVVLSSLLKTIVVQCCTVAEVLTEDLYRTAEKAFPKNFAHIGPKDWVSFISRRGFRTAYKRAFASDPAIDMTLADKSIDALSLLRNVIVHRAAVADEDFTEGVKVTPLLAPFKTLNDGDPVILDGEIVHSIIDPAFKACYQLIENVDQWLKIHKIL